MLFTYDISVLPLLFISAILLCLTLMATRIYMKTNMKKDLHLAISFAVITLFSLPLYKATGEHLLINKVYYLGLFIVVATTLSIKLIGKKEKIKQNVPELLVAFFAAASLIIQTTYLISVILCFILIVAVVMQYVQKLRGYTVEIVRMVLYLVLAVSLLIGGILTPTAFAMLYSLTLAVLALFEATRYLDIIIGMLRNVGTYSITDPLTRIYNKGYFMKKTAQLIESQNISIIFCDIDNFKKLNDTKGHDYGDEVLIKAAALLKRVVGKKKGLAFRFGGEELVGVTVLDKDDTTKLAEEYRVLIEKEVGVTVSIGVATSDEIENVEKAQLAQKTIKLADLRLYVAKATGKNKVINVGEN